MGIDDNEKLLSLNGLNNSVEVRGDVLIRYNELIPRITDLKSLRESFTTKQTMEPTEMPTKMPTMHPTEMPTMHPTKMPTMMHPTKMPTMKPTKMPTKLENLKKIVREKLKEP